MSKTNLDWTLAVELRDCFLAESATARQTDYWKSKELVELYDETFAQRIGWKWDAVLENLPKGLSLPRQLVDWGAGTGIASRRFLAHFPETIHEICLIDRSPAALQFAKKRLSEAYPSLKFVGGVSDAPFVLVLSHVLSELTPSAENKVRKLASRAQMVVWVEPGTPDLSRKLIAIREELRREFSVVAPCPHQLRCGLLTPENERHWCHFFAKPPQEIFHSAFWKTFSQKLHIDLRSLPVSYLVLQKTAIAKNDAKARVIGRSRDYKGVVKSLICDPEGTVEETSFIKSKNRELTKKLSEGSFETYLE